MSENNRPKILVVEDDEHFMELLNAILKSKQVVVLRASDGKQAWTMAMKGEPDAVLMDVVLKGETGFEICRRFRSEASFCKVPMILISGQYDTGNSQEALAAGADKFLSKTMSPFELVAALEEVLSPLKP